jgi:thiol-disulfide isomerase/thioredoxin
MKHKFFSTLALLALSLGAHAQDSYQITGKTSGIEDGKVYLISCMSDTLGVTDMKKGMFVFSGSVKTPNVAYIRTEKGAGVIPLMLENTNFQILAGPSGVKIVGGPAQEAYEQYQALVDSTQRQQNKVQQELQAAYQEGNQMKMEGIKNQFAKYVEKARKQEEEEFGKLTHSFVGGYVLATHMMEMPAKMLRQRYDMLDAAVKETPNAKAVLKHLEAVERISEGRVAPDFSMLNNEGDTVTLSKVKGKVKLLDFWASWCGPCRKEMPNLVKLYKDYQTRGLEIVSVSLDTDKQKWQNAMIEEGMTWKNLSDLKGPQSPVVALYAFQSIPFTVLLDSDDQILAVNLRGEALQKKIAELLK